LRGKGHDGLPEFEERSVEIFFVPYNPKRNTILLFHHFRDVSQKNVGISIDGFTSWIPNEEA